MAVPYAVRQGDIMLVRVDAVDLAGAKKRKSTKGRVVCALGEVTGHSHTLTASKSALFDLFDGREVVVVDEPDTLHHQEHAGIAIEPGMYWLVRQREYRPDAIVRVQD